MWIAKPINSLKESELETWRHIEKRLPLAQSLCWAYATEAVAGQTYLIFSPEERVGGIVFTAPMAGDNRLHFECVNGPHLHWDHPSSAARQFATFAMAVSKLDRQFGSLRIKPRWESHQTDSRLKNLPIPLFAETQAATLIVPVLSNANEQLQSFTPRLRRTLSRSLKSQLETKWEKLTIPLVHQFVPQLTQFGASRGFTIPPIRWFEALLKGEGPEFWLVTSIKKEGYSVLSETTILVCIIGNRAHYLFGFDKRSPECRAAISTSVGVHWKTLMQCLQLGIETYDLNGYLINADPSHPYYGVCKFKEQFGGKIIPYRIPEFIIQ